MWEPTEKFPIIFQHANGDSYRITRNGGSKFPGYKFKSRGASDSKQISCTEDLIKLVRSVLFEGIEVRCQRHSTNKQEYCRFRADELINYKASPRIAGALGISETGNISTCTAHLEKLDGGSLTDEIPQGAQEKSIIDEIKRSVLDTVSKSNGQVVERKVKNKELLMSDAEFEKRIRELLEIQEERCAISGLPFQYKGSHDDENLLPSLDRIDSDGHYSAENVQLVCRFINFWKQDSPDDEFRRLISLVRGQ